MKSFMLRLLKGLLGVFAFLLISGAYVGSANADTVADDNAVSFIGSDSVDLNTVMQALDGWEIKDGDRIPIDDEYVAVCDVTMAKPSSSRMSTMSSTNTYIGSCNIYVMHLGTNTMVAYINHNISVTYYDNGLVHINSGSLNAYKLVTYVSTYVYDYQITNTNGSYSYATGMVRLYDATVSGYYYYGCGVSVTPGSEPRFSFSQVY